MGLTVSSAGRSAAKFAKDGQIDHNTRLVALAGNPNVGKSSIFNALTGLHQHTGNWTGKTVGCSVGVCRSSRSHAGKRQDGAMPTILLADLPGCYSLNPHSAEEEEALDFLCTQCVSAVVVVCDTMNLSRNMLLAYQIKHIFRDHPIPIVVCVNLIDEAAKKGIEVDSYALSSATGFRVVTTSAKTRIGLDNLRACIENTINDAETLPPWWASNAHSPSSQDVPPASDYLAESRAAVAQATLARENKIASHRLPLADRLCMGRYTAVPVALMFLSLVFWLTITAANYPSAWLATIFESVGRWLAELTLWGDVPWWIKGFLIDGVYRTLSWVISVMLPPMAIFFPLYTLLEDVGFLPRIAFNFDRCFRSCDACGKQALTMCMGFGCNAAGVTACRIIDSPRERMIAILTNGLVPCNGKFPTILAMISILLSMSCVSVGAWSQWLSALMVTVCILVSVSCTLLVSKLLSKTLLRGHSGGFILELPPYRVPNVGQVLVHSLLDRTLFVLGRAVVVAAPVGGALWILGQVRIGNSGLLIWLAEQIEPIGVWLGVDGAVLLALILSAPANELVLPVLWMIYRAGNTLVDYGTTSALQAQLSIQGWTLQTVVCFLTLFLFHMPCSTTLLTIRKETGGWRWALLAAAIPVLVGILLSAVMRCLFA